MKRFIQLVVLAGLTTLAACAGPAAKAPAKDSSQEIAKAARAEGGITCAMEHRTGSHVPQRVCMTDAARKQRQEANQQAVSKMTRRRSSGGTHSNTK